MYSNPSSAVPVFPLNQALPQMAFIIVAGICACLYFLFLCFMVFQVFRNISGKRSSLPAMSKARRLHYEVRRCALGWLNNTCVVMLHNRNPKMSGKVRAIFRGMVVFSLEPAWSCYVVNTFHVTCMRPRHGPINEHTLQCMARAGGHASTQWKIGELFSFILKCIFKNCWRWAAFWDQRKD